MTRKFVITLLLATAFAGGVPFLHADDHGGHEAHGADINGTESFDTDISMIPTVAAPPGSEIKISFEAENEDGATEAKLKLEPRGLPAGTYTVSATLASDASSIVLGQFTVGTVDNEDDNDDDQDADEDHDGDQEVEFGTDEGIPFAANFNPFDIAALSVADANGVILFNANLTAASGANSMNLNVNVQATPGPTSPTATGNAVLTAFLTRRGAKGSIQLNARGLLGNTQVVFAINGANVKKVNTSRSGTAKVRITPSGKADTVAPGINLFGVTSVSLRDTAGNTLLSASF